MIIQSNISLKSYTTFGIEAKASRLTIVEDVADLQQLIANKALQQKHYILGGGSNVVLSDDYEGLIVVMRNKGIKHIEPAEVLPQSCAEATSAHSQLALDDVFVEAQAGEVWDDFVRHCIAKGWHGAENLIAIPGTVGAAPVQNVGAYGLEAKDIIHQVHAIEAATGRPHTFTAQECHFAYRNSIFKQELAGRYIVTSVVFRLSTVFRPNLSYKAVTNALAQHNISSPTAQELADAITEVRWSKLPKPEETGSAGSFFKNPIVTDSKYEALKSEYPDLVSYPLGDGRYKLAAGWLIEHTGWKGKSLGPVGVWPKQALVLVNHGIATGADVMRLADAIVADVDARFGVILEKEAIVI